jgi:hypothetical protein
MMRTLKSLAAVIAASLVGTLGSCGTMGGGMKYFTDPPPAVVGTQSA